jgi:D-alanine transaminase/branched-chain amino acid aminotransferase
MDSIFTCIDGKFIPFDQSTLHVSDLIVQRGYGIFDFFLVRDGVAPYLSFHLDRFIHSAELMKLDLAYTKEELSALVVKLVAKNNIGNSSIKIMLTGGLSTDDFTLCPGKASLIIINKPYEVKWPDAWKNGGTLISCKYQREMAGAKTINYIRSVGLSQKLLETGAAELLYTDRNWVRECSRSNVYFVKDQCVFTPKTNMLEGVTRRRILALEGFRIQVKDFKLDELLAADEVFITSTTKGVLPIIRVDAKIISDGNIGPVTKAIKKAIMGD